MKFKRAQQLADKKLALLNLINDDAKRFANANRFDLSAKALRLASQVAFDLSKLLKIKMKKYETTKIPRTRS